MIESLKARFESGTYAKGFLQLLSAAGFAQALPLLIMPILTRLYSPEDFAVFGFLIALLYAFGPSVSLRIDAVQMMAPDDTTARTMFAAGLINAFVVTLLILSGAFVFDAFAPIQALSGYAWWLLALIAVAIVSEAYGQTFLDHMSRHKRFGPMSKARVVRTVVLVVVQLAGGLLAIGYLGLVLGVLLSAISVPIYLATRTGVMKRALSEITWSRYIAVIKEYKDYVVYGGVTNIVNTVMLAIPVLFFTTIYPEAIAGQIVLAMRAVDAGMQAIREATVRIHARRVLQAVRENNSPVKHVLQVAAILFAFGIVVAIVIILGGEHMFRIVFGDEWQQAGRFAGVLVPALVMHFVASALSGTMSSTRRIGLLALWRIGAFIATLGFFLLLDANVPVEEAVRNYAILTGIVYFIYFLAILYSAANPHHSVVDTKEPDALSET